MSLNSAKQSVYIIRYGNTKFDRSLLEFPSLVPFDSDIDLTEGSEHAKCIASAIAADDLPSVVYSSPFQRCAHTAQLIALSLRNPTVRIEEGLTEWLTPSLVVDANGIKAKTKSVSELCRIYGTIDYDYQSVNPVVPDDSVDFPPGAPKYEESEDALLIRCATTLRRILENSNGESFVLVSHAACDQALAFFLEGAASPAESKLGPWPLGGITKYSRPINCDGSYGQWQLEKYAVTSHMPGKYKPGVQHKSLPSFAKS